MAQSRAKRKQRGKHAAPATRSPEASSRSVMRRRVVIAFLVLIGLAGILAISPSGEDGDGAPRTPGSSIEPGR